MTNRDVVFEIRRIPSSVLAAALPHWRPFTAHAEVCREFAQWVSVQKESFGTWQAAWNRWTRASGGRAGTLSMSVRCSECNGRQYSLRHGRISVCGTCLGRRTERINTAALYQKPPKRSS